MSDSRSHHFAYSTITGLVLVFAQTGLSADEEAEPSEDVTEEIVVYAIRPGDKIDIDARYEELLRSTLIKEFDRMRALEEDYKWRSSESRDKNPSRIKWGHDPREELRMRRDTKLTDLPIDDVEPATVFRFEF